MIRRQRVTIHPSPTRGIGNGRPPIEVHVGGCYAAGKRRRTVPRDEARRLLTSGVRACTHCTPDAQLRILD
ncbi:DUF6233 domain-containing protein [Streptomyces mirabilis]|nr:DUF6233 domain-containing protein [Streptomyces mirabilis]